MLTIRLVFYVHCQCWWSCQVQACLVIHILMLFFDLFVFKKLQWKAFWKIYYCISIIPIGQFLYGSTICGGFLDFGWFRNKDVPTYLLVRIPFTNRRCKYTYTDHSAIFHVRLKSGLSSLVAVVVCQKLVAKNQNWHVILTPFILFVRPWFFWQLLLKVNKSIHRRFIGIESKMNLCSRVPSTLLSHNVNRFFPAIFLNESVRYPFMSRRWVNKDLRQTLI